MIENKIVLFYVFTQFVLLSIKENHPFFFFEKIRKILNNLKCFTKFELKIIVVTELILFTF